VRPVLSMKELLDDDSLYASGTLVKLTIPNVENT